MHAFGISERASCVQQFKLTPTATAHIEAELATLVSQFFRGKARIPYEPGYDPQQDEVIEAPFTLPPLLHGLVDQVPAGMTALSPQDLAAGLVDGVLFTLDGTTKRWVFQAIDSRNLIRPQSGLGTLLYGKNKYDLAEEPGVVLSGRIDAIFQGSKLLFNSEFMARRLLSLDALFKAASDETLETFFGRDEFAPGDMSAIKGLASDLYRRKIARVIKVLDGGTINVAALRNAAHSLKSKVPGLKVDIKKGKLVIPTDKNEFVEFVRLLNDDYVQSAVDGSRKFFAGSKRKL